jgi:hypothetical protein
MKGKREKKRFFSTLLSKNAVFSGLANPGGDSYIDSKFNIKFDDTISDGQSLRY